MDQAHANYDMVVHKLAVKDGLGAFSTGSSELVLKYYAYEYVKRAG